VQCFVASFSRIYIRFAVQVPSEFITLYRLRQVIRYAAVSYHHRATLTAAEPGSHDSLGRHGPRPWRYLTQSLTARLLAFNVESESLGLIVTQCKLLVALSCHQGKYRHACFSMKKIVYVQQIKQTFNMRSRLQQCNLFSDLINK